MKKDLIKAWFKLYAFAVAFSIVFLTGLHGILHAIRFYDFSLNAWLISLAFVNIALVVLFAVELILILRRCKR